HTAQASQRSALVEPPVGVKFTPTLRYCLTATMLFGERCTSLPNGRRLLLSSLDVVLSEFP
ncbi:hypothetical protein LCGC14_2424540, partial [marine sediment metagenome]